MRSYDRYVDDDDVVADGQSVKVRMDMMDSLQRRVFDAYGHQPHFARMTDAQATMRREARDAMIKRAENAWRTLSRDAAEPDAGTQLLHRHSRGTEEDDNAAAAREKSYIAYKARLESAWRNPAAAAERNEKQLEAWRKPGARPGLRQEATNDRAAAYAAYVERIGSAWRAA